MQETRPDPNCLEGGEAILRLIQRFPNLSLTPRGYEMAAVPAFRGMSRCWLRTGI